MTLEEDLRSAAFAGIALMALSMAGCSNSAPPPPELSPQEAKAARAAAIEDCKNGVFVFPAEQFPTALSEFRETHPNARIVSVCQGRDVRHDFGLPDSSYAVSESFIVITESKVPTGRK